MQSGASDEDIVADPAPVGELHHVLVRQERRRRLLDPGDTLWDQRRLGPLRLLAREHATAHQCPARLIGMRVGRFNDGDRDGRAMAAQHRRHGDPSGAAADDQDRMA